jgi:hypothetical protein
MRVAVLKLGARIVFGDKIGTSGGTGEAVSLINMLQEGGFEVDCYTKVSKKDPVPSHVKVFDIKDYGSVVYDHLFVINGSVNFFGGAEDPEQILNYKVINNFQGPVTYLYCDPNLPLRQIWPSVQKKEWAANWSEKDINITRKINIVAQIHNLAAARKNHEGNGYEIGTVVHYPFYKFPMMFDQVRSDEKNADISYGGTFRSGRREKKLIDFYFGYPEELKVEVFGKIKAPDFNVKKVGNLRHPLFTGAVDYNKMIEKMSRAKAHVVIGDTKYPDFEMISQRAYESIMAGCVTFIDSDFDRKKRIFGHNKNVADFVYVDNREQVYKRLSKLNDNDLKRFADIQLKAVGFDRHKYTHDLTDILKGL